MPSIGMNIASIIKFILMGLFAKSALTFIDILGIKGVYSFFCIQSFFFSYLFYAFAVETKGKTEL